MALMSQLARVLMLCSLVFWTPAFSSAAQPDAVTPDGGRYYGALVGGKMHGHGRIEWDNGASYVGNFSRGLYSGRGRSRMASGDTYEGQYRKGAMSGRGRYRNADGSVYTGEFRRDSYNGQGRFEAPDGDVYEGSFKDGRYHGQGHLRTRDADYKGEFRKGRFWGQGEIVHADGRRYRGGWVDSHYQGKGRFESPDGRVYEGDFDDDEFTGGGTFTERDGVRHEGRFVKWRPHGAGRYTDSRGNVYEGNFVDGQPSGVFVLTAKGGVTYEGELRDWRPQGRGVLRLANGDVYRGDFEYGRYHGQGTLTYAKAQGGVSEQQGTWRYGTFVDPEADRQSLANVETALYNQRILLDKALSGLAPRKPKAINLYLLAVGGDGSQEVFRRETEFVQMQFDERLGTRARSLRLVNSRNTVATEPMATLSSIREGLQAIASRMDKSQDILFLYLTSHGSAEHEFVLNQNNMRLRGLTPRDLSAMLEETGIRWKVIVVSACYSGGFVDALKDDHTLVIAAARHDRRSFGCSDTNDFTYFGRAYFKEALPGSASFTEAFQKAEILVREWETKELKEAAEGELSLPQISSPDAIDQHLRRWRAQLAP